MKHIICCLIVLFSVYLVKTSADYQTTINGTTYLINYERKSWEKAFRSCKRNKMELISINTPEIYDGALEAIYNSDYNSEIDKYWTSGTDIFKEDAFFWASNGELFDYQPWHKNQPDNGSNNKEHCVELKYSKSVYKLNDNNCKTKNHFICTVSSIEFSNLKSENSEIDVNCQIIVD